MHLLCTGMLEMAAKLLLFHCIPVSDRYSPTFTDSTNKSMVDSLVLNNCS